MTTHRFTVEQYHQMIEAGILTENDRVELLDGWILPKMPHNPPHDATVSLAQHELSVRITEDWIIRIQSAITTADSEPEPDVTVAKGPLRRYSSFHPRPRDIGLIIEVSDTTLTYDQTFKGGLYARARIPVYWVINLIESKIEVYTKPKAGKLPGYQLRQDYGPKDRMPLLLRDQEFGTILASNILP
jgi:Uma2 family endonuclease